MRKQSVLLSLKVKKRRIWEIDFLRGFSMFLLFFHHLAFNISILPEIFINFHSIDNSFINSIYRFAGDVSNSNIMDILMYTFSSLFLLLVGISCSFSRNNLARGVKLSFIAIILSVASRIAENILNMNGFTIVFGILHLISFTLIIIGSIELILKKYKLKINPYVMLIISFGVLIFGYFVETEFVSKYYEPTSFKVIIDIVFGFKKTTSDHFAVFPYAGIILFGYSFGKIVYHSKESLLPAYESDITHPFEFLGRHSLFAYFFHQFIFALLIGVVMLSIGYRL